MLRVAVPNKGSLNGPATQLLSAAGYRVHREHKALFATDVANDVQFVFLRPTDIARNVGAGVLEVGITGQDLLAAAGNADTTIELLRLDFGVSKLSFAAPRGVATSIADLDGKRVATSFSALVTQAAARARPGPVSTSSSSNSMARWRPRSSSGWLMPLPMWWRPAPRCKRQACTPSENQSCGRRRCWCAVRSASLRRRANKSSRS